MEFQQNISVTNVDEKLETSHTVFDLEPPSYNEILKIINKKSQVGHHGRMTK